VRGLELGKGEVNDWKNEMAEFLRLKTSWLNVDKIIRVENVGTESAPSYHVE
jgi:hypothetical protein